MKIQDIEERIVKLELGRTYLEEKLGSIDGNLDQINKRLVNHISHLSWSAIYLNIAECITLIGLVAGMIKLVFYH